MRLSCQHCNDKVTHRPGEKRACTHTHSGWYFQLGCVYSNIKIKIKQYSLYIQALLNRTFEHFRLPQKGWDSKSVVDNYLAN